MDHAGHSCVKNLLENVNVSQSAGFCDRYANRNEESKESGCEIYVALVRLNVNSNAQV